MSACANAIRKDEDKEAMDSALFDLRTQIQVLNEQNAKIRLKLNEETEKNVEMTRLLHNKIPFKRTKTGEMIFPGKKEMKFKLDIMTNELLKLKKVLDCIKRDRSKIFETTQELLKTAKCSSELKHNTKENLLIEELDEQYNKLVDTFSKIVVEISKCRVKLDELKIELDVNEKKLEEIQVDYNEVNLEFTQIESESDEKNGLNLKNELDNVDKRLDELKSEIEHQMEELNTTKKRYMDAIQEKEYQSIRRDNLCKEKTTMMTEFEIEYNRIKKSYKKRLGHMEYLLSALQAVQEQLAVQKELKNTAEKNVENLSKKLKTITEDTCEVSDINSKQLMKLKVKNTSLKTERENLEKVLADIERCYEVARQNANKENSRLDEIKIKTTMKINELRNMFKRPTEDYLRTIDKLQNQIAKIKAHSCFEDGKQKLVSSVMQDQINALTNILKGAQEQIAEIEKLKKYSRSNLTEICGASCT